MKDENNTEVPGAPLVPKAKIIKTPPAASSDEAESISKPEDSTEIDKDAEEASQNLDHDVVDKTGGQKPPKGKIRRFFRAWWENKTARWATIIGVLLVIAGLATYPSTRYLMLNTAGIRSSASVTVIDNATRQPLKNVTVKLNNATGTTNNDGYVKLDEVRLGSTQLIVERTAFAPIEKTVTVGWGSNPLGEVMLEPKGIQYSFVVKDFLSGLPLEKAEASSGDASAFSDKDGKITLTLDTTSEEPVEITVKIDGYRDEKLTETAEGTSDKEINMVPAQPQAFISKRSGKYDLYKIYADGSGEELVMAGTGFEREDIVLVSQPTNDYVALVSTRDGARGADGNLLSTLNIVNISTGEVTKLDTSDRIQPFGWIGNTLIYVSVGEPNQTGTVKKQKLLSYNLDTSQKLDITSANYFNSVIVAGDKVYYAPAAEFNKEGQSSEGAAVGFYSSNTSGTESKRILDQEVWSMVRTSYDTIALTTGKDWYEYKLGDGQVKRIGGAPVNQRTKVYTNNSAGTQSLWIDQRDGKGVLLSYDVGSKTEKILVSQSGLVYPVRWLNNTTAVYRINTDTESADYVVSLNGGDPRKIVDVTNTSGVDKWYYY